MKSLILLILITFTSCTTNKALNNARLDKLGPTSITSISLGGLQGLR